MSKRAAEDHEDGGVPLKGGERPEDAHLEDDEVGEFEDEFEDEYESEDEIIEAGVDGRPDAEREEEERAGRWRRMQLQCWARRTLLINTLQKPWM
jgi:ribosome assembly protein RRB1